MHINKVILCGVLAGDPSTTFTEKGTQQATFAILTEKTRGEQTYRTYTPCVAWGKNAERIAELGKGDTVSIDGELIWQAVKMASPDASRSLCSPSKWSECQKWRLLGARTRKGDRMGRGRQSLVAAHGSYPTMRMRKINSPTPAEQLQVLYE